MELDSAEMSMDADSWQSRYLEMQANYRVVRKKNREQAKMSRQLIEAVKNKLQQTDRYIHEVIIFLLYFLKYYLNSQSIVK